MTVRSWCEIDGCRRVAQETLHFPEGRTLHGFSDVRVCLYHYVVLTISTLKGYRGR